MDFENIKELIKLVNSSSLSFFELQNFEGKTIKMDKSLIRGIVDNNLIKSNDILVNSKENFVVDNLMKSNDALVNSKENKENFVADKEETSTTEKETTINEKNVDIITSPMVGTFYSSASPESAPFVQVGDRISKGKIICIIEAMKLMNEIESEYDGVIIECLAKGGDMVEYGQPLFKVKGE